MQREILENWPALSRLLDEAIELPETERRTWLDALPPEHARLRPALARLLSLRPDAESFLEQRPLQEQRGPLAGTVVGSFRLVREIGRGGMGTVWLAKRLDGRVDLPVAVKLPFAGVHGEQVQERFERERHILAALNHPNIARFYEAGTSADGRSYLALEYVEGESLPEWCNRRRLGARRRIELYLQVLRAVQYAHASLVIHRDLKPSNIVVTATGEVKLLDFGIAKLLDRETQRTEQTELTQLHGRLMTLDYASPEQVRGEPLTTATDVYSLGVVLYELLAGKRPYRLRRGSSAELEEAILTSDTARPSQSATAELAAAASVSLARWRRALRGDLDTLALKALEKDRDRRYASVEAFAQDCERYLQGLPLAAQPPGRLYRARKFIARNRLALGAASAVAAALLAGTGVAIWQARIAIEQSRVAAEEAGKQRAVQSFLTSLFDKNTRRQPDAAKARSMTVRELLLEASERLEGWFTETPTVRLELLNTVASLLRDIDEYERAATLSAAAVEVARTARLTGSDAYVEALMGQTTAARLLGRGPEAIAARDEALRVLDARGDRTSLLRARANTNTVAQFSSDPRRETALVQRAVELFEQRYPAEPEHFTALFYLGNLHRTQQRPAEAERSFRRAIAVFDQSRSRDFTNLGASYAFAGMCQVYLGKIHAALQDYERGLELLQRHAGPDSLITRFQRTQYAEGLSHAGRLAEALGVFEDISRGRQGPARNIVDFDATVYGAFALLEAGRAREAQAVLERFSNDWVEFGKRFAPNGRRWVAQLAYAHAMQGRAAQAREALTLLGRLPATFYEAEIASSPEYIAEVAWIHLATGDASAAATAIEKAAEKLRETPQSFDWVFARLNAHASFVAASGSDPTKALRYADAAVTHIRALADQGGFPFLESRALVARGQAQLALGRMREAIDDLEAALTLMRRLHAPDSPWLLDATAALAVAYRAQQQEPRANDLAAQARAIARRHPDLPPWFLRHLEAAERG
jgi:serine/threonine-protein kinase